MTNRIDALKKAKGLSYSEIARDSGITASYICALAKGRRVNPSADAMEKISEALNEDTARVFPLKKGEGLIEMPRTKLQDTFPKHEPVAPFPFEDLPDWFGRRTLMEFMRCSNLTVMQLLNTPVEKGGVPCRKIGNQYRIIKNEFGKAWGFISDDGKPEEQ